MSVKKETDGRRSVQVEIEVPGTPEEVWRAIATGHGIACWFVPTDVEERAGGAIAFHLGPGMDSSGTVTEWKPPHRFVYEERDWMPGAPPLASEWLVETRSGGMCVVRVVHSLFASGADWDEQLESMESGWPGFFRILRMYLTHFRGERCSTIQLRGGAPGTQVEAWKGLSHSLGLEGAATGERRAAPVGVPPLAGTVERVGEGKNLHEMLLRLHEPAPGAATITAYTWADKVQVGIGLYLYGDRAAAVAARDEELWQRWMNKHFPSVG
jgi:uncharacterized protein YndB with AHSA1/START domain